MLANNSPTSFRSGTLTKDVQKPECFLEELIGFVADELPRWRDRPDRPSAAAEPLLTSQLCAHLNSAARHAAGWDILQFRAEAPDEAHTGRRIDLVPAPCGVTIWIEGRGYSDFDPLLPIECKRLPTPPEKERDHREYVFSQYSTTGGIQRFKSGHHGSVHSVGAMIGYVQEDTPLSWHQRVKDWISELATTGEGGFSEADQLEFVQSDEAVRVTILTSSHDRVAPASKISLRHLWVEMN